MRTTTIRIGLAAVIAALASCTADVSERGGVPDNGGADVSTEDTASAALTGTMPPASEVYIKDTTYSGSGCPAGSADVKISSGRDLVYVGFDKFIAATVPGGASLDRKNCALNITLHFPPGWTVALSSVDYRGFAGLKRGVTGEQKSTYYFAGGPLWGDTTAKTTITGPFADDYGRSDGIGVLRYSPCGAVDPQLVINAEVRVLGIDGQMTVDSIVKKVQQVYHLTWKRCP